MVDYPDQKAFENSFNTEKKEIFLTFEESNRLYQEVLKDYEGETKFNNFKKVKANEYLLAGKISMLLLVINLKEGNGILFYRTAVFT
jgi:hypothetical protein